MSAFSIKVQIGNRTYPLTIKREEEEQVRRAAKLINDRVREYEENYFVRDKQDLLAMCALQLATELLQKEQSATALEPVLADRITEIERFVSDYLKRE